MGAALVGAQTVTLLRQEGGEEAVGQVMTEADSTTGSLEEMVKDPLFWVWIVFNCSLLLGVCACIWYCIKTCKERRTERGIEDEGITIANLGAPLTALLQAVSPDETDNGTRKALSETQSAKGS